MATDKIKQWRGGPLRVFVVDRTMEPTGTNDKGETLYAPRLTKPRFLMEVDAKPFGDEFAIVAPNTSQEFELGIQATFDIRDGRLQCVAIEPLPDGPELTQARLRIPLDRLISDYAVSATYRLELDEKGDVVGVPLTTPRDAWNMPSWEEIKAELPPSVRRPGRPRISDEELKRVASVVREAEAARQSIGAAVAKQFHLTPDAAKKRIRKARDRGFLPPTKRGGSNG